MDSPQYNRYRKFQKEKRAHVLSYTSKVGTPTILLDGAGEAIDERRIFHYLGATPK